MSDLVDGRNATIAAAQDLGLSKQQVTAVGKAFHDAGIVTHWQKRIGVDSRTVFTGVDYIFYGYVVLAQPTLSGKFWAMGDIDYSLPASYGIFGGSTVPHTDGKSLVWISLNADRSIRRVMHRDLASGKVTVLHETDEFISL